VRVSFAFCRRLLLIDVVLLVGIALAIPWAVIPPVRVDTFPNATPESAVPAFWIITCFHVLAAAVVGRAASRMTADGKVGRPWMLVPLALLVLLSAYALEEPGRAYSLEGPAMRTGSMVLLACAASDLVAALLMLSAASLLRRRAGAD
jgi:branched-subunit amino acid permease